MSRFGKIPVEIPKNVEVQVKGSTLHVKGPKGTLEFQIFPDFTVVIADGVASVVMKNENGSKALHGLLRAQINNMVVGVSQGFEKKLALVGVGYRATLQGNAIELALGFSKPIKLTVPANLKVVVDKNVAISVSGIDKQLVGQFAATIRSKRPPEPYKGKGIRYENEFVRKKDGKAAKGKAA